MASTEGLVPITRSFLASYYDKLPVTPLSDDVSRLSSEMRSFASDFLNQLPSSPGETLLVQEDNSPPPYKIDENMWKNREQMDEILANDDSKEITVPAGKTHEVSLIVESINSYIAWDFSLVKGKINMDIGFSIEYTNPSGERTLILPYWRYESDQGNFCTILAGNYKLIWDNAYSAFFKKSLRYKVDCIPPVAEPQNSITGVE